MRKEIVCYVATNEEGEEVQVRKVMTDPQYMLFSLGQNRMVLKISELVEAMEAIHQYSAVFAIQNARSASAPPATPTVAPTTPAKQSEFEVAFVSRTEPTDSELALQQQMEGI